MNHNKLSSDFILHIQGLRGLAISLVFLFHYVPALCPYGYIGVDLFFIISGFFLFRRSLNCYDIDIIRFFRNKISRILFPVLFTIAIVLVLSILVLPSIEMMEVYLDGKYASTLTTNFQLNQETSSYFSKNIRYCSLMHLWYICVLMQALVFFSVIFFVWRKFNFTRKWRIVTLLCLGFISLMICFHNFFVKFGFMELSKNYVVYTWTTARLWELIAGGLLSLIPSIKSFRLVNCITLITLGLFICLAFFAPLSSQFVIAVAAFFSIILILGGDSRVASKILCSKPLFSLGKISFSLYLAHWPIIWISEYLFGETLNYTSVLFTILSTTILTSVIYCVFEKRRCSVRGGMLILFVVLLLLYIIDLTKGFKDYLNAEVNNYFVDKEYELSAVSDESELMKNSGKIAINTWGKKQSNEKKMYYLGNERLDVNFVLMGDSHAYHFAKAFDFYGKQEGWRGIYLNTYVNPFYHNKYIDVEHTPTDVLIDWLKEIDSIKYVVVAQWWAYRFESNNYYFDEYSEKQNVATVRCEQFREFCNKMKSIGKEVIVMADTPSVRTENPGRLIRRNMLYGNLFNPDMASIQCTWGAFVSASGMSLRLFKQLEKEELCKVLLPHVSLFDEGLFSAYDENGLLLSDGHHLTMYGARKALFPLITILSEYLGSGKNKLQGL